MSPAPTIQALFPAYVPFVWRTLRHFGVAETDLEDQTQEVFLVAHRRLADWDGDRPRSWLYGIVRRCAAGYRRRSHRRHEQPVETLPETTDRRDPSARVEFDLVRRAIDALDDDKRVVFILHEIEEMPMREVADAVDCPLQTAYTRLYAARRELARALEETT